MVVCDVPKGYGTIRPGAHLRINDRIVYAACLGACYPYIHKALSWSQGETDFSYQLSDDAHDVEWIKNQFVGWIRFRESTLAAIEDGASHVVVTDVTAYYDNVDLQTLMSDLRQTGAPEAAVLQLSNCLNRWAESPSRGIPQGHAPSDILGKLYLDSVDENLRSLGCRHTRYVDDFRIFCEDAAEAKQALLELTRLLRKRGLSLQTKKTEILPADKCRQREEAVAETLLGIRERFLAQIGTVVDLDDPYVPWDEIDEVLENSSQDPDDAPIAVIREAYESFFLPTLDELPGSEDEPPRPFDKTLFHFLLNRLGRAQDDYAADHCLTLLRTHPEETKEICRYLARVGRISSSDTEVLGFLCSPDALYPYQVYQLIEWRLQDPYAPAAEFLAFVRHLAFDGSQPTYVRTVARKFLADFGTSSDLERLQHSYSDARGDWDQCEILWSLKKMERRRRNTFLGRFQNDSPLHERVVALVRSIVP